MAEGHSREWGEEVVRCTRLWVLDRISYSMSLGARQQDVGHRLVKGGGERRRVAARAAVCLL